MFDAWCVVVEHDDTIGPDPLHSCTKSDITWWGSRSFDWDPRNLAPSNSGMNGDQIHNHKGWCRVLNSSNKWNAERSVIICWNVVPISVCSNHFHPRASTLHVTTVGFNQVYNITANPGLAASHLFFIVLRFLKHTTRPPCRKYAQEPHKVRRAKANPRRGWTRRMWAAITLALCYFERTRMLTLGTWFRLTEKLSKYKLLAYWEWSSQDWDLSLSCGLAGRCVSTLNFL